MLYQDYLNGCLDIYKYMEHSLSSIKGMSLKDVQALTNEFTLERIKPRVYQEAWETLAHHRSLGHHLLLISASSTHIVAPIGEMLGVDTSIGVNPEVVKQRYTGVMTGIPSFKEGKVTRFKAWVKEQNVTVTETWFYSDSPNDIPLLEYTDNPIATNPTLALESVAKERNWPIIRWKAPDNLIY